MKIFNSFGSIYLKIETYNKYFLSVMKKNTKTTARKYYDYRKFDPRHQIPANPSLKDEIKYFGTLSKSIRVKIHRRL